ncbi:ABC transporter permease [Curtobacterium sp. MWU13-2055]|uniref:ABC transporter permease n=1 Tax=Curtobacterium sp. MWU13-2055 TaxID=2931928 RepID=UPI00200C3EBA|nr:ABC transporter permease [Curtobacterium sp. MWU13-2055]
MSITVPLEDATEVEPIKKHGSIRALLPSSSPKLIVGVGLTVLIVAWGFIGPLVVGDPNGISSDAYAPPSLDHLLGTTQTGQDVWTQVTVGIRGSIIIGFAVGILSTLLSAIFGILGAYIGGWVDEAVALFTNVFLVIPGLPLVIVIGNYVPVKARGLLLIALVLAITSWAGSARVLRAVTLGLRNRDYVAASRISGEKTWRVLAVEILPNLIPVMASQFVFAVIFAILGEAGLSFLGIGASGTFTLGSVLFQAYNALALTQGAWWWFVPPGLVIALLGAGLTLINFSIDEIINPKLRDSTRSMRKRWKLSPAQIKQLEEENAR